jgi:hypothetical protein
MLQASSWSACARRCARRRRSNCTRSVKPASCFDPKRTQRTSCPPASNSRSESARTTACSCPQAGLRRDSCPLAAGSTSTARRNRAHHWNSPCTRSRTAPRTTMTCRSLAACAAAWPLTTMRRSWTARRGTASPAAAGARAGGGGTARRATTTTASFRGGPIRPSCAQWTTATRTVVLVAGPGRWLAWRAPPGRTRSAPSLSDGACPWSGRSTRSRRLWRRCAAWAPCRMCSAAPPARPAE